MATRTRIQIQLTPEQQAQIAESTGKKLAVVELKPEALEPRVAPGISVN